MSVLPKQWGAVTSMSRDRHREFLDFLKTVEPAARVEPQRERRQEPRCIGRRDPRLGGLDDVRWRDLLARPLECSRSARSSSHHGRAHSARSSGVGILGLPPGSRLSSCSSAAAPLKGAASPPGSRSSSASSTVSLLLCLRGSTTERVLRHAPCPLLANNSYLSGLCPAFVAPNSCMHRQSAPRNTSSRWTITPPTSTPVPKTRVIRSRQHACSRSCSPRSIDHAHECKSGLQARQLHG
jgi:hypothetical protein